MKKIVVDKGLDQLKEELEKRGYLVEAADEISGDIAAYIYNDKFPTTSKDKDKIKGIDASMEFSNSGYLLVKADGKELEQIVSIIEQRLYSPLF